MTLDKSWKDWVETGLDERRRQGLLRSLTPLTPQSPVHVTHPEAGELILFSSNDYLGLSGNERVIQGVVDAVEKTGLGPRGSPLICGYTTAHHQLELELADWKGTEAALLASTGFAANLAVISALADGDTTIFSDALNHASIIDGCALARRQGARVQIYPHADVEALAAMLDQWSQSPDRGRAMVVTDSVFSMDGDLAPLRKLAPLCERHGALLVIDEAHGSFVFGDQGRGVAYAQGVTNAVDVHVGTLSKGAGGLGGFIATTERLRQLLLNLGRSYIYSTAAPLSVIGGLRAALDVVRCDQGPRRRLWDHIERLAQGLGRPLDSPIVPLVVGDERETLQLSRQLRQRGIEVTAIRPPTVAEGTSRLRITLSAAHSPADIDRLVEALQSLDVLSCQGPRR